MVKSLEQIEVWNTPTTDTECTVNQLTHWGDIFRWLSDDSGIFTSKSSTNPSSNTKPKQWQNKKIKSEPVPTTFESFIDVYLRPHVEGWTRVVRWWYYKGLNYMEALFEAQAHFDWFPNYRSMAAHAEFILSLRNGDHVRTVWYHAGQILRELAQSWN